MVPLTEVVRSQKRLNLSHQLWHKDLQRTIHVIAETDMVSQVYPLLDARRYSGKEYFFQRIYLVEECPNSPTYLFGLFSQHEECEEVLL